LYNKGLALERQGKLKEAILHFTELIDSEYMTKVRRQ